MRGSPLLRCRLPPDALQSLEDRLRALDTFLADYLHRRRGRLPGGAGAAGGDAGALPAAKRQRLEDAQQAELKRWVARASAMGAAGAELVCSLLAQPAPHNMVPQPALPVCVRAPPPPHLPPHTQHQHHSHTHASICRTEAVRALVARAAEACFLLRVLCEHNIGRLALRMEEGFRSQLRSLRFRWGGTCCGAGGGAGEGFAASARIGALVA